LQLHKSIKTRVENPKILKNVAIKNQIPNAIKNSKIFLYINNKLLAKIYNNYDSF